MADKPSPAPHSNETTIMRPRKLQNNGQRGRGSLVWYWRSWGEFTTLAVRTTPLAVLRPWGAALPVSAIKNNCMKD